MREQPPGARAHARVRMCVCVCLCVCVMLVSPSNSLDISHHSLLVQAMRAIETQPVEVPESAGPTASGRGRGAGSASWALAGGGTQGPGGPPDTDWAWPGPARAAGHRAASDEDGDGPGPANRRPPTETTPMTAHASGGRGRTTVPTLLPHSTPYRTLDSVRYICDIV